MPASVKGLAAGFRQMRKPWAVLGSSAEPPPWGKLSQGPRKSPWTLRSSGDPVCHLPLATVTHEHKQWLQTTQTCYPPVLQARSPKSVSRGSKGDSLPLYFFWGGGNGCCSYVFLMAPYHTAFSFSASIITSAPPGVRLSNTPCRSCGYITEPTQITQDNLPVSRFQLNLICKIPFAV